MLLLNAFSLNMIAAFPASFEAKEVTLEEARALLAAGFESAVGHADTANVFARVLGLPVGANRSTVSLKTGSTALVGQYRGPRLPEGATELPAGATIQWIVVTLS